MITDSEIIMLYIPVGHRNAVDRAYLSSATGMSDRRVRNAIHKTRRNTPILNMQDGRGYYIPDSSDVFDRAELRDYIRQETSRLMSIRWALKAARNQYREICHSDSTEN